jgi:predicted ribosome quality control (RQC) complex YloA/Tae2 family protein
MAADMAATLTGSPRPLLYYTGTEPTLFSLIPLQHLSDTRVEEAGATSGAILRTIAARRRSSGSAGTRTSAIRAMRAEIDRQRRTLEKVEAERARVESPAELERAGKLLQAQLHAVEKGASEVIVEDFIAGDGRQLAISLDPHLTPGKNVERYFARAQKAEKKSQEQTSRARDIRSWLERAESALAETEGLPPLTDVSDIVRANIALFPSLRPLLSKASSEKRTEPPPFRRYVVQGGFEVWVGKNAQNNDLLSTRHTAKNDLWFHARGAGGSHVVLKRGTATGEPGRTAIAQAAAVAAYYSKMKKATHVAVSMCEGKYVRKPKGANPGTVTIEREEVLFVDPALPPHQELDT